jgi:tetratricopeptide (TPR) repeat protein
MLSRYSDAIAEYEKAVDQDDSFWPAVNNIGLVLYEQGEVEEAVEQWQESLDISEAEAEPMLAIATAQYVRGDRQEAVKQAIEALMVDSRYADLEFLRENLWGEKLLADAEALLNNTTIQRFLAGSLSPDVLDSMGVQRPQPDQEVAE